jgi:hypothetical protein
MAEIDTVEVECRECGKRARQGIAVRFLTNTIKCKRGLRERNALNCPSLLRAFSAAKGQAKALVTRRARRLLDPQCQFDNQCQQQRHG